MSTVAAVAVWIVAAAGSVAAQDATWVAARDGLAEEPHGALAIPVVVPAGAPGESRATVPVAERLHRSPVALDTAKTPIDTAKAPAALFTRNDLWFTAGVVAATVAMTPLDKRIAHSLQDSATQASHLASTAAQFFNFMGNPGAILGGASLYVTGRIIHSRHVAALGLHGTEAIIVASGAAEIVKGFAGRARPFVHVDDPDDFEFARGFGHPDMTSFPSGHATSAFAAATVVTIETHRWWPHSTWYIAPVMYGGATMVGLARMYSNKHWASDVLLGAGFGTLAAMKVERFNHKTRPGNKLDKWLLPKAIAPAGAREWRAVWSW